MNKLNLRDVTLVVADTVCHELTRRAIEDCIEKVEFFDVIIASDRVIEVPGTLSVPVGFTDLAGADDFRWTWHKYVKSTHMLVIEWDSWVLDPGKWNHAWLAYDYLGAPWPWHKTLRVGNGGFSLRSRDLMAYVDGRRDQFPNAVHEDDVLCRLHRPILEQRGFVWGGYGDALRFAFERSPAMPTFGFHGLFNWPKVLSPEALAERVVLCGDYVRAKSEWAELGITK